MMRQDSYDVSVSCLFRHGYNSRYRCFHCLGSSAPYRVLVSAPGCSVSSSTLCIFVFYLYCGFELPSSPLLLHCL